MARIKRNQMRMDSETEQLPATLTPEEEQLAKLAEKNNKFERSELVVPRLKILQPLNPEVQEGSNQYVEGAKPGMFYNTSSGKLTPGQQGIIMVVVGHQRQTIEWVSRDQGGGLVKIWGADEGWKALCDKDQRDAFNPVTKEGHTIDKQRSFLIFDVNPDTGEYDPSFFNFRSTATRTANLLSTMLSQTRVKLGNGQVITPPFYYFTYKVTLDKLSNNKGTWWSAKIVKNTSKEGQHIKTQSLPNGEQIFQQAVLFQEQFMEGSIAMTAEFEEHTDDLNGDRVTF
jgi:hypothetical protein